MKVFLVEDEIVVREGIKNNIDWQAHGYEFCGEASDGELAFPMIQKLKPDIVITDICMPFMDGLALSRLIKKELPYTEIIVISGYEDFKYAKEGISIGIAQYLLKPVNGDDLIKEVDAIASKIEESRKEREFKEKYMKEMEDNFLNKRKDLFQYLVTAPKPPAELLEMADQLDIDLSAMWYNILLIKIQSAKHMQGGYSNDVIEIEDRLETIGKARDLLVFDRNPEGKAVLFKADSKEEILIQQEEYADEIKTMLEGYENIRYFGGIGEPVNRLTKLPFSFERASHAFAHRYLVEDSLILDSSRITPEIYSNKRDFDINSMDIKQLDRNKISEFLKFGDKGETHYFIDEFFRDLGNNALSSSMFRQYIIMDIYFCVAEFLEGLSFQRNEIETPDTDPGIMQSEESAISHLNRIIVKALELREKAASNKYGSIVDEVIRYIEENYSDDELSLNMLASHVNFSPNHLSMVFAQQMGQTFTRYLTAYRMDKAKELLKCTSKRSSEISREVGYKDPHYFSYLFRKIHGMTPTQYRGGKGAEGED